MLVHDNGFPGPLAKRAGERFTPRWIDHGEKRARTHWCQDLDPDQLAFIIAITEESVTAQIPGLGSVSRLGQLDW